MHKHYSVEEFLNYAKENYKKDYGDCGDNEYLHVLQEAEIIVLDMLRQSSRFRRSDSCCRCPLPSELVEEAIYIYTYNAMEVIVDYDPSKNQDYGKRASKIAYMFLKNHGAIRF